MHSDQALPISAADPGRAVRRGLTQLQRHESWVKAIESPCKLDSLPDQCTRLSSHPGIMRALEGSGIDGDGGDGNVVRVGFDACLRCGTSLPVEADDDEDVGAGVSRKGSKKAPTAVSCRGCNRIRYCSTGCRAANAEDEFDESPDAGKEEEEPPSIPWHSPVVCALLGLCDDDDLAEEELTLLNVPHSEAPDWFVDAMTRRLRNRGGRMRRGSATTDRGDHRTTTTTTTTRGGRGGEGSC